LAGQLIDGGNDEQSLRDPANPMIPSEQSPEMLRQRLQREGNTPRRSSTREIAEVKTQRSTGERLFVMRELERDVGANDGNINAPSSRPICRQTRRASEIRPRPPSICLHLVHRSTTSPQREGEEKGDEARPGTRRGERAESAGSQSASCAEAIKRSGRPTKLGRSRALTSPAVLMPKAFIYRPLRPPPSWRFDATGWNMLRTDTGCPVSTPERMMSSTSKSMASPMRTLWRTPSSTISNRRSLDARPRRRAGESLIGPHSRRRDEGTTSAAAQDP